MKSMSLKEIFLKEEDSTNLLKELKQVLAKYNASITFRVGENAMYGEDTIVIMQGHSKVFETNRPSLNANDL